MNLTDGERLDWLEQFKDGFHNIDHISSVEGKGFNDFGTLREAIDDMMNGEIKTNEDRILKLAEVKDITGLSKSSIYKFEAIGQFPSKYQLSPKSVGWKYSEVLAWISNLQKVEHNA